MSEPTPDAAPAVAPTPRRSALLWLAALQLVLGVATLTAAVWAVVRTEQLGNETASRFDRIDKVLARPAPVVRTPDGREVTGLPLLDLFTAPLQIGQPNAEAKSKPAPKPPPPPPTFRTFAVLPLREYPSRDDIETEAKRLHAGISAVLKKNPRFKVTEPEKVEEAVKKLDEKDRRDPVKSGRALGVEAVVTGKFNDFGNELSLQAALVEVETGLPVWSKTYELGRYFNDNAWKGGLGEAARKLAVDVEPFAKPAE